VNPLATARQLWRLNQEGRLVLVQGEESVSPIGSADADAAIKAVLAVLAARAQHS
jgi:hypothetical protein